MQASFALFPLSLLTEHILTRVEASNVLSFCFSLVHEHNPHDPSSTAQTVPVMNSHANDWTSGSEFMWHHFPVYDFFISKTDAKEMYLRT
jgi:hypothetical protein